MALPKRYRRLALKCVLSDKAREDRLICLNSMDTLNGKTKSMVSLLQNLNVTGSALVVTKESQEPVVRSAQNLNKIWTIPVNLLNAHELLRRDIVIMTVEAARWAEENLQREPERKRIREGGIDAGSVAAEALPEESVLEEPVPELTEESQAAEEEAVLEETPDDTPASAEEESGDASEENESTQASESEEEA